MFAISCLVMEIDAMHMIYHREKLVFWRGFWLLELRMVIQHFSINGWKLSKIFTSLETTISSIPSTHLGILLLLQHILTVIILSRIISQDAYMNITKSTIYAALLDRYHIHKTDKMYIHVSVWYWFSISMFKNDICWSW